MRRNGFFIFRVFFHKLQSVNKRIHQEHKNSLKLFRISPFILLVLSGVITMINFPQQNFIEGEAQAIFPESSDITFLDSMQENQTLEYQTNYQKTFGTTDTENDNEELEKPRYTVLNSSQDIIYDSINDTLNVTEKIGSTEYIYIITSTSNIPTNKTLGYPYDGGWQHNFPTENSNIELNAQEITSLITSDIYQIVLDFKFLKNEILEFDDVSIPTKVFNASSDFQVDFDEG